MWSQRRAIGSFALPVLLALGPEQALAQRPVWVVPEDPTACTARIPEAEMRRVAIYASPWVVTPSDSIKAGAALVYASGVTVAVAGQVRRMLGARGRDIPEGDSVVRWQGARTSFRVTAHRDKSLAWQTPHPDSVTPTRTGYALLARALSVVRDSAQTIPWPKGVQSGTIVFDIVLDGITFDREGQGTAPRLIDPHPVFSIMQPSMERAQSLRRGRVSYPMGSAYFSAGGSLLLRFQVDTTGRVNRKTITDVWPEDRPRQKGELGDFYRSFIAAVRRPLNDAEFSPARIGGCPVASWVEEFHDFRIIYRH